MRISVVIPALNEAGNIGRLVEETYASVPAETLAELIVVDDASDDGTGGEVKALIGTDRFPGLRYLRHGGRAQRRADVAPPRWSGCSRRAFAGLPR